MAIRVNPDMTAFAYDDVDDNGRPVRRINIEHAEIPTGVFRDFKGMNNPYISFNITIPEELENVFTNEGVNVSHWLPADAPKDSEPYRFVKLKINYGANYREDPEIKVAVGSDEPYDLYPEAMVKGLDDANFEDSSFIVNVYHGVNHGNPYVSLYVYRGWFTIMKSEPSSYMKDMIDRYSNR